MSIFEKRVAFKPFEYPEVVKYKEAINHSYWLVSEWDFLSDIQDFHVKLSPVERNVIKNALLAISQIEISVKKFWTKLGDRFPKAEMDQVGVSFGEAEIRHSDAYSQLLEVLGLNDDFAALLQNPVIQGRVDYLTKYLKGDNKPKQKWYRRLFDILTKKKAVSTNEEYTLSLALFSIFIENVSLFSQFLIIKSFNKYKNVLKDIDNVVQSTQQEERIHALFGIYLINQIKKEFPEWFNDAFYIKIKRACVKAYDAECAIIDWIFEEGELPFLSPGDVKEFIKNRFNESLQLIGAEPVFTNVDGKVLERLRWFDEEIDGQVTTDFFHKRPVTYSKKVLPVQAEDLF